MVNAILNYTFMRNAFLAGLLTSIICGIIGTIIVEKKLVSLSGGIAHASFGGIGLGYFLGIEPIIGGLIFAVTSALGIAQISRRAKTNADTLIGMFWAIGMALGIFFIALTPGYPPEMESYLFGDILTVSTTYLIITFAVAILVIFFTVSLFDYWKAYLFDEEFAKVSKVPVIGFENLLFILTALCIVVLIKVVGIILAIALLTIPIATAKIYCQQIKTIMFNAIFIGMLYNIAGLYVSYTYNIPSGATIILVSAFCYFLLSFGKYIIVKR